MNIANFGIGLILAFIYGWAICLCILAFVPFIVVSGVLQVRQRVSYELALFLPSQSFHFGFVDQDARGLLDQRQGSAGRSRKSKQ